MNDQINPVERVIGFDAHPDSFTAAVLRGRAPSFVSWSKSPTRASPEEDFYPAFQDVRGGAKHRFNFLQSIIRGNEVAKLKPALSRQQVLCVGLTKGFQRRAIGNSFFHNREWDWFAKHIMRISINYPSLWRWLALGLCQP